MINRCSVLKKIDLFHTLYNAKIHLQADLKDDAGLMDKEKLEVAGSLEHVLMSCYKSLISVVRNRTARGEFHHLAQRSVAHQRAIMKLLEHDMNSEENIEQKRAQYLSNLQIEQSSMAGLLNMTIGLATHTMDIYRYLSRTHPQYESALDRIMQDSVQEIEFLRGELEFHQKSP